MGGVAQQGWNEQTPASQAIMLTGLAGRPMNGGSAGPKRRRKARSASGKGKTRRRAKRAAGKAAKFVKGSAAAKRHMAKLRKMVGKRR